MGSFHWLHFSDLHLTPKVKFDTQYARARLLEFLGNEVSAGRLPCDYIFLTGDIANKGKHDSVPAFMQQLFASLSWRKRDHVFWAAGNHDISRENKLRSLVIGAIRSRKKERELFEECMDDPEIREVLLDRCMGEFYRTHKEVLRKDAYSDTSVSPHEKYSLPDLNLVVLNTCITSCDEADKENLFIRERGLQHAFEGLSGDKPTFVMGHHGREYFRMSEQDILDSLFESDRVDLYLCGHAHRLGHTYFPEAKRHIHQITCGGGNVNKTPSKFTFIHGYYDSEDHSILIKPYSYEGNGNRRWHFDEHLHLKLDGVTKLELTSRRAEAVQEKLPGDDEHNRATSSDPSQKKQAEWSSAFFQIDDKQR